MEQKSSWLIKVCCVLAAVGLWFYINSSENPRTNSIIRNIPVQIVNSESLLNSKLIISPNQEFTVNLSVRGKQSDINLIKKDEFKIVADIGSYAVKKGENKILIDIKGAPDNVNVVTGESTMFVRVNLDDYVEKSIPIKIIPEGKTKDGFYALEQNIKPSEALVTGAAEYVKKVYRVETKLDLKNSDKDISLTLPLQAVDEKGSVIKEVEVQPKYTDVTVPVKKTKTVGIKINTKGNINKDIVLKTLTTVPDKIDIAGGDNINNIANLETEPVDLSLINQNRDIEVKIIVPSGVTLVNSNGTVIVRAGVDKIIQKSFTLDIVSKNLKDQYTGTLSNSKVTLTVSGAESVLSALKNEDIIVSVDLNSAIEGDNNLPIKAELPNGVSKVSLSPDTVKVTINKK